MTTKKFVETPDWRPKYAVGISELLNDIPKYSERIKSFMRNSDNNEFIKGFLRYHRLLYLTEYNRSENADTPTFEYIETMLNERDNSKYKKIQNLSNALNYLFENSQLRESLNLEFNIELAKKLNELIGDGLFENAGCYRKNYARPACCNFLYLAPHLIEQNMNKLFSEIKEQEITRDNWYEVAAYFLAKFLFIHPFVNGNGRTARLLISVLLTKYSVVPVSLFVSTCNLVHSNEIYLRCISEAQRYNNRWLLNSLIIESVHYTLHKFIQTLDVKEEEQL